MSLNPDLPRETSQVSALSRSVPPGVPLRYFTSVKVAGSLTVRSPRPRRRIQSFSHPAVGRPVRSIWILRYSVSVERPGFSASIGFCVGVAPGDGDAVPVSVPVGDGEVVPSGEAVSVGDPVAVGESVAVGEEVGDCEAASGSISSIATRERTATTPIALDRLLKRALLYAVAPGSATRCRRPPPGPSAT